MSMSSSEIITIWCESWMISVTIPPPEPFSRCTGAHCSVEPTTATGGAPLGAPDGAPPGPAPGGPPRAGNHSPSMLVGPRVLGGTVLLGSDAECAGAWHASHIKRPLRRPATGCLNLLDGFTVRSCWLMHIPVIAISAARRYFT